MERRLLADYETTLSDIASRLTVENHAAAVALARYPEKIRGFGHVKAAAVLRAVPEAVARRETFHAVPVRVREAAE
jgi:indolepyruvate ferredoxin oxidoreductase